MRVVGYRSLILSLDDVAILLDKAWLVVNIKALIPSRALCNCIVRIALCGLYRHKDCIAVQVTLCGVYRANCIMQIALCEWHSVDSIVVRIGWHYADCIVQIAS